MMLTKQIKTLILLIAIFGFGIITGVLTTSRHYRSHTTSRTDTLYIERTIEAPISDAKIESHKSQVLADIPREDIKISADSSIVSVSKDSVIYKGVEPVSGATYEATVTGVQPSLDKLQFTIPERIVTKTVVKPYTGWSIGVFGDGTYQQYKFDAKAGFYASYTAGPFCLHFDAGAIWTDLGPNNVISPYIGAGVRMELFRKR